MNEDAARGNVHADNRCKEHLMSEAELFELLMMSSDQVNATFEFWLTLSFGVLIAVHFARDSLRFQLKALLCAIYVAASVMAILLTAGDVQQVLQFDALLGTERAGKSMSAAAGAIRFCLYLVGTVSIALAIFKYDEWFKAGQS